MDKVLVIGTDSQDSLLLSRFEHKFALASKWKHGNENMKDIERKIFKETLLKMEEMK